MTDIILSGCCGVMGKNIAQCIEKKDDCRIVAGIDIKSDDNSPFPIYKNADNFTGKADVIIDFSHPSALNSLLDYAVRTGTPAVISTTGLSPEQVALIHKAATSVPIFFSANMSLGVSLITELAQKAVKVLGDDFDIEIIEKHHNQKIDAPSGTALMLADAINSAADENYEYKYNRQAKREKRKKNEIGIHAVRGGTIVGEHDVIFAGQDEIITISHSARSKQIFAVGSVNAALFIKDLAPGLYSMKDLVEAK